MTDFVLDATFDDNSYMFKIRKSSKIEVFMGLTEYTKVFDSDEYSNITDIGFNETLQSYFPLQFNVHIGTWLDRELIAA